MNLKSCTAAIALLAAGLALAGPALAQTAKTPAPTRSAQAVTPAQARPAAPQGNQITQAVAQQGVSKCLGRVNQVTSFLTGNAPSGAMLFVSPANGDRRLASVSMEIQTPNALTYANTVFAPGQGANECGATYEGVTYWNASCDDVATRVYAAFKPGRPLRQYIAVLDGGPAVKVFLMPAGQGCVSVKKEMVYQ